MQNDIERVCIFCGAYNGNNPVYTQASQELGKFLASQGIGIVYGGASIGLMGAMADSALAAGGEVIGVIPTKLYEYEIAHTGLTKLNVVGTMHERKEQMAAFSDAFIALPGGIGTLEALFEIWTWAKLKYHHKPCAIYNINGYYDKLLGFIDTMVREQFLDQPDAELLHVCESAEEIVDRLVNVEMEF